MITALFNLIGSIITAIYNGFIFVAKKLYKVTQYYTGLYHKDWESKREYNSMLKRFKEQNNRDEIS